MTSQKVDGKQINGVDLAISAALATVPGLNLKPGTFTAVKSLISTNNLKIVVNTFIGANTQMLADLGRAVYNTVNNQAGLQLAKSGGSTYVYVTEDGKRYPTNNPNWKPSSEGSGSGGGSSGGSGGDSSGDSNGSSGGSWWTRYRSHWHQG